MTIAEILGLRFYFGTAPVFAFSVAIYLAQFVISMHILRQVRLSVRIGLSCLLLIASYSLYELAFKLSFLVYGGPHISYFLQFDLLPSGLLAVTVLSLLAVKERFTFARAGTLLAIAGLVWVVWFLSGSFPLYVQTYEQEPTLLALIFNILTKSLVSVGMLEGLRPHK